MGEICHEEVLKCHAHRTSVPQPAGTNHYIRRCFSSFFFSTASERQKERREERKEGEGKKEEERKRGEKKIKERGKEERKERKRKEK
jgi:hypothetical protein